MPRGILGHLEGRAWGKSCLEVEVGVTAGRSLSLGLDAGDFTWSIVAASHCASGDFGSPRLTPGQMSASRAALRASIELL